MALITQFARLFRADLNGILDCIEEPALLLRQSIREMEEALVDQRRRIRSLEQRQESLAGRVIVLEARVRALDEQLDVCFEAEDDRLARDIVRRRLQAENALKLMGQAGSEVEGELTAIRARFEQDTARLDQMKSQAELLAGSNGSELREESMSASGQSVSDTDVEVAFLREQQRRGCS
ncbi:MAG: hypothetical protein GY703_00545 [Gammaproteobacteria bacterium]|nr:hypothetical protein [Gammaproteobacteria bacterium]